MNKKEWTEEEAVKQIESVGGLWKGGEIRIPKVDRSGNVIRLDWPRSEHVPLVQAINYLVAEWDYGQGEPLDSPAGT